MLPTPKYWNFNLIKKSFYLHNKIINGEIVSGPIRFETTLIKPVAPSKAKQNDAMNRLPLIVCIRFKYSSSSTWSVIFALHSIPGSLAKAHNGGINANEGPRTNQEFL